jgi:hypothetical protein
MVEAGIVCANEVAGNNIRLEHVMLISQWFRRGEGTWGNFEPYILSSLAFLNKPIMSAYLVIHPKWRISYAAKKPIAKPRMKRHPLTLSSICRNPAFTFLRSWT